MKKKYYNILKYLIYFVLLMIFFTVVCPIVPYEGDDWYFIGSMRQPIPYFDIFNPSKVLPEVLEPICGNIGAYIIYPITHDYIGSLSLAAAIVISGLIVLMLYLFYSVLTKRFKIEEKSALIYEFLFIILFFIIFKRDNAASYYGFWSKSFNCYFNYTILGIFNACVVLFMMKYENFQDRFNKYSYIGKGFFLILLYFTIFSSLQFSIILASFAFIKIVDVLVNEIKKLKKKNFKDIIMNSFKNSYIYYGILLLWIVALIYDFSGLRGKMVSSSNWLTYANFKATIDSLISLYKLTYKPLITITVISFVLVIIGAIKNKKYSNLYLLLKVFSLFIINTIFLVLLYMNAGAGYAARVDATWGILFYLILLIMSLVIICNDYIKFTQIFVPIIIVIFTIVTFNFNYPFAQSVFDAKAAKKVDNYIINQIIEADKKGECCVSVKVPKYANSGSNWPLPYNMATWLQNTLYAHKIIRSRMYIRFVPDKKAFDKLLNKNYSNMPFFDFERSKQL